MAEERLQKIISRAGLMSRRKAEQCISAGRVSVDGLVISKLGAKVDPALHTVCVDGSPLSFDADKIYILLNKPKHYLSTARDDRGRNTVLDLIPFKQRLFPVGRLDFDTEGLILLTNDGDFMHKLLHPKFKIEKTYRVKFAGELTEQKLNLLRNGVQLVDGFTAPCNIFLLSSNTAEITLHEGKNRQVRRMFAYVGCQVLALRRIKFAGLNLNNVPVGKFRLLSHAEVSLLKNL